MVGGEEQVGVDGATFAVAAWPLCFRQHLHWMLQVVVPASSVVVAAVVAAAWDTRCGAVALRQQVPAPTLP